MDQDTDVVPVKLPNGAEVGVEVLAAGGNSNKLGSPEGLRGIHLGEMEIRACVRTASAWSPISSGRSWAWTTSWPAFPRAGERLSRRRRETLSSPAASLAVRIWWTGMTVTRSPGPGAGRWWPVPRGRQHWGPPSRVPGPGGY
jgi:hypothetical protein